MKGLLLLRVERLCNIMRREGYNRSTIKLDYEVTVRPVMPLVVGGWLDVLLIIAEEEEEEDKEEVEEEEVEEEMLIGEDIVDTGVDSAVVDNVDDSVDEVGT